MPMRKRHFKPFPKRQILNSSKLKEFADNNFKFDENGGKFIKQVENTVGKGDFACTSNFSFSLRVFRNLVLQTLKNQGLFGKGLNLSQTTFGLLQTNKQF